MELDIALLDLRSFHHQFLYTSLLILSEDDLLDAPALLGFLYSPESWRE